MAHLTQRRPENQPGNLYVDSSCIDCDTCRWMAPDSFDRINGQSAVIAQPTNAATEQRALQALLSCPTASIGTLEPPADIKTIQASFPIPIVANIFHCGYHAQSSFGAASYLILRSEGNILIDSPRFAPPLVKRIEELGGVKTLYLTHRDDIADHQKWHDRFGCDRILHEDDIGSSTQDVEHQLTGSAIVELTPELKIIPVPGHTKGHTVLLYQDRYLFTGDHLALSRTQGHLVGFNEACWYSWEEQIDSMKRLRDFTFEWVLPGHGRRFQAEFPAMKIALNDCIDWMEQNGRSGDWD
jgi:glyoxylase-like metal-dependent hydrolase (beta-lactamase superfamily II)/ferredoxin